MAVLREGTSSEIARAELEAVASGLVLVLCCVNVTNLLMARGVARERDLAIRRAMGASRVRIVRLLITENAILGLFAGAVGFVIL